MNKYVKYPLVLGLVALISGGLLAGTYHLTKESIENGKIDRQTSAINDLFTSIDSKELVEVPEKFSSKGIQTIVKVVSKGKTYNCYTINFKDSVGGDASSVIIVLDSNAKVFGVKILQGDSYMSNYNNSDYLATVVNKDSFDKISGATMTAGDLNNALKLAKDCFKGNESSDPIEELFDGSVKKEELSLPSAIDYSIKKVYYVTSENKNYYVFDVSFKDSFDMTKINILYALNDDGTLYKIKQISGDSYSGLYDGKTSIDTITNATYTGKDLQNKLVKVNEAYSKLTSIDYSSFFTSVTSFENIDVPTTYTKIKQIVKVVNEEENYYIFRVKTKDSFDNTRLVIDYALKENGDIYKIKVIDGDNYAKNYHDKTSLDLVSGSTVTNTNLNTEYSTVKDCLEEVK